MKHFYILLFIAFFSLNTLYAQQAPFITTWEIKRPNLTIKVPTQGTGYNYTIDFGDGTIQNNVTGDATHTYNAPGIYTVTISGNFPRIYFNNLGDKNKILSVDQWGDIVWTSMERAFRGCSNLVINATDAPDLSQVTNMSYMFSSSSINQDISHWDVSNVENMEGLFRDATSFNQPLNTWDVSSVQNMAGMFRGATSFNQPLDNWDVSNVSVFCSVNVGGNYVGGMFENAVSFNGAIDNWDLSGATHLVYMFRGATSFNQPIDNWNVAGVTSMVAMFQHATSFNQSLNSWDMSNVVRIENMFEGASSFNGAISNWDVSKVENMDRMFKDASSFNQPLNNWDVSNVMTMQRIFNGAISFNQPINNWDTSSLTIMDYMFLNAISFNQPVYNWNTSSASRMVGVFREAASFNQDLSTWDFSALFLSNNLSSLVSNTALDVNNYEALLNRLVQFGKYGGILGAVDLVYCDNTARDILINTFGWRIIGDSFSPDCNNINGSIVYDFNNNGCDINDIYVNNFLVNATDGTTISSSFSDNGIYSLNILGTNFTVSVVNQPSYFTVTPASVPVTFTTSSIEIVDFCVTANQTIEDLNITLLPIGQARPGFNANYRLVVRNIGTQTIANVGAILQFDDQMQQFVSSTPAPGTTTANTLTFPIGTMQPFQTVEIDLEMLTFQPPTVNGDDILNFTAHVTPSTNDFTPIDNTFNLAQVVVNSYDPNDKQVLQGEELHINQKDEYLDYIIRFQNTGTASAINVRILDTLHPKLDWNTLVPISASHDYYVKIKDGNHVEFMFDDIHLPDSISNEPASHGYVAYKIKPKSNVQVGDVISGDAAIYFDFNEPIITNMVTTTIVEPVLGISDISNHLTQVVLYPNPTEKMLRIDLPEGIELDSVLIYDLQGREVQKIYGKETKLDVENLSRGMYLLKIKTNQGTVTKKFIKD